MVPNLVLLCDVFLVAGCRVLRRVFEPTERISEQPGLDTEAARVRASPIQVSWLMTQPKVVPPNSGLYIYEKCGEMLNLQHLSRTQGGVDG